MLETRRSRFLIFKSRRIRIRARLCALERKRRAIWRNGPRNHRIAEIARAFCDGAAIQREWTGERPTPQSVAVLVESYEHFRRLADLLPDADLDMVAPTDFEPWDGIDRPYEPSWLRLVTSLYAEEHSVEADVVVRATGGRDPLPRRLRMQILVDFEDEIDKRTVEDTDRRIAHYVSLGWLML